MASTRPQTDLRRATTLRLGLAVLGVAALIGLLLGAGTARAAVQVVPIDGPAVNLSLDRMPTPPDVNGAVYTIRSEAGASQVTVSGYSLLALLEAAQVDPITIGYVEIPRPGGGSLLLSRSQATKPGAFPEGPPVVYRDSDGIHLLRPTTGEGDLNAADLITLPPGSSFTINARSGTLIQVSAEASPRRARVGQEVRFKAKLGRSAAGEQVQISWYFDDGGSAAGAEVRHRFRRSGLYDVVVGVTTPDDRVGASATVTVQVGQPEKQGPKRRGGGTNKAKDAPDSGASRGGSGPAAPSSGPLPPGPLPPASGPGPSSAPVPVTPAPPPPQAVPEPEPEPEPQPRPQRPTGDEIVGELLSAEDIADEPLAALSAPPEPSASDETVAARTGSAEPEGGGGGIPGAAVGVGAAILMLFGGGLLEARGIGRLRW